jgi:ABC-type nitrate/sulfonate/bicarbonate transport system substrate-binding protein
MTPEQTVAGRDASGCIERHDNVSALHARGEGAETRLVGLVSAPHYQAVLALPGAGVGEPAQLAGRRLGLPARDARAAVDVRRAAASRGFHSATALACLFCDEYEEVALPPAGDGAAAYAAEAAALADGSVDAIYVAGPEGRAVARRLGAVEVVDLGRHLDPMVRVNVTTPLAVTVSERLLRTRPRAVARQLAELPEARLDARALDALRVQKDWLLTHGHLDADVDVTAWADAGPLDAARG